MTNDARVGIVLAGGFATRFAGGDKLLAELDGRSLLTHAIEGVAPAVDGVVVSCREEQLEDFRPIFDGASVPVAPAPDPVPDRGPAAGLANSLDAVGAPWVAAVAGDMPFVDGDLLSELFDRADDGDGADGAADGAVPEVDGHLQPTHAVYRTDALRTAAADAIERGDGSLRATVDRLDATVVPEWRVLSHADGHAFTDVNTVADLEEARERVADGGT